MKNIELVINEKALEKIHSYAKVVCSEAGCSRECYGYLLAPKDKNDGVVYDAILAYNQKMGSSRGEVDVLDVLDTKEEYNSQGYKAIGCWQSHGHGRAFHSSTDDENLDNLVLEGATNCILAEERLEAVNLLPDNKIYIARKQGSDLILHLKDGYTQEVETNGNEVKETDSVGFVFGDGKVNINLRNSIGRIKITTSQNFTLESVKPKQENRRSIFYSLVVNTREEDYAEVGIVEWNEDNTIRSVSKERNLKIRRVDVNGLIFSYQDLLEEVRSRLKSYSQELART